MVLLQVLRSDIVAGLGVGSKQVKLPYGRIRSNNGSIANPQGNGALKNAGTRVEREFFQTSPHAIWVFALDDGRFLAANPQACERYGYTENELLDLTLFDVTAISDAPALRAALAKMSQTHLDERCSISEHRAKSGERLLVDAIWKIVVYEDANAVLAILRDVTQEQALIAERNRFFEMSPDIMTIRTLDRGLIAVNPASERILGWSPEELNGLSPNDLFHTEDLDDYSSVYRGSGDEMDLHSRVLRTRAKDGSFHWMHRSTTVDHANGRIYTVSRDVTELRALHERLSQSEANLAWAQRVSHLGSWSFDATTETFAVWDEYYRISGYEPGGFAPTWENIIGCVHPEDRGLVDLGLTSLDQNSEPKRSEIRILRPTGEIRIVLSYVEAEHEPNGALSLVHGTIQDVTELKKLQENQEWLAGIVSSSDEAIIGKRLDGTILSWNRAAEELYGYCAAEMIGQNVERLVPPRRRNELRYILAKLRAGKQIAEFETERMDRNGRIFETSITISPIVNEGRIVGATAVCRDISARKEAERQVQERLAQITALRSIDQSIAADADLCRTLEIVVAQTLATTGVDAVCVLTQEPGGDAPVLKVARCRGGEEMDDARRLIATDLARRAVQERQTVRKSASRNPARGEPARVELASGPSAPGAGSPLNKSETCVVRPLLTKGNAVGALAVHRASDMKRSAEASSYLDLIAGQTALAIDSARLREDLERSRDALERAYDETLEGWARALDLRDHETEGHSRRVTELTVRLAERFGLRGNELVNVRRGALLHDIGKLGIPDSILLKPGALTESEWEVMRNHPIYARDILVPIAFLASALDIPYCHHERWDGTGYPQGLRGEEIPVAARLFAFSDVWDALTSDRPYRAALTAERALDHITSGSGKHFDPDMMPLFLEVLGPG